MREIVFLRGLPGSGKSTAARLNKARGLKFGRASIISTDDYFDCGGHYLFDPKLLGRAHEWNQDRCRRLIQSPPESRSDLIVVDNTNVCLWEMKPYLEMGIAAGYEPHFIHIGEVQGPALELYAERNTHGVPLAAIQRMASRFEPLPKGFGDSIQAVIESQRPF